MRNGSRVTRSIGMLLIVGACGSGDANLRVDLRTDYAPGVEVSRIEVDIEGLDEPLSAEVARDSTLVDGIRVGDADLSAGSHTLSTSLLDRNGSTIATQITQVRLDGDSGVTVLVTRDCAGVACPGAGDPAATACIGATCASPTCTLETPELCPVECMAAADCEEVLAACAEHRCVAGSCFAAPIVGACSETEACNPTNGCIPIASGRLDEYADITGLVALWSFDEGDIREGDVVVDTMAAHDGSMTTNDGESKTVAGVRGNALRFDGEDDRVTIPPHADFDRPTDARKTFMGWVRRQGRFDHSTFITFNFGEVDACYLPHFWDDTTIRYWDDFGEHAPTEVSLEIGVWHHYATTVEGDRVRLYWDGAEVASMTGLGTDALTVTSVTLGWQNFDFYSHYDIDEVSVWNRVLSVTEIQSAYATQRP